MAACIYESNEINFNIDNGQLVMASLTEMINVEMTRLEDGSVSLTCLGDSEVCERANEAFDIYNSKKNKVFKHIAESALYATLQEEIERLRLLVPEEAVMTMEFGDDEPCRINALQALAREEHFRMTQMRRQRPRLMHMMR
jgi:hypothetical protein